MVSFRRPIVTALPWRCIVSGSADPAMNMAIDEALLRIFSHHPVTPVLRLYSWEPAGFTAGLSQDPAALLDLRRCREEGVPCVRRMTGGSLIYHKDHMSYSVVCSAGQFAGARVVDSYYHICSFLLCAYRALGLDAAYAAPAAHSPVRGRGSRLPAFCFASSEKYDILVGGRKLGGNAQRRYAGCLLQHGSIPLSGTGDEMRRFTRADLSGVSAHATSLGALLGRRITESEAADLLRRAFADTIGVSLVDSALSAEEEGLARELRETKYGSDGWNLHRLIPDRTAVS